jgi:large subunit ribosomal protein L9
MKVILLKDVPKIGRKYETKDVSDGHAANFLIPRGLAEVATNSSIKKVANLRALEEAEHKIREDLLLKNLADLEGTHIEVTEKANDKGHLFAGLHKEEIAKLVVSQTRLEILPAHIVLDKPIKTLGDHEIHVEVQGKKVKFKLTVNAK